MRLAIRSLIVALLAGMAGAAAAAEATPPQPEFHALASPAALNSLLAARQDPTPAPVQTELRATLAPDGSVRTQCEVVGNPAFHAWQQRRAAARLAELPR